MKNGYEQFFKKARMNAAASSPKTFAPKKTEFQTHHSLSEKDLEAHLKRKLGVKTKRRQRRGIPWKLAGLSLVGLVVAAGGFLNYDKVERLLTQVEVSLLGSAQAQTAGTERDPAAVAPVAPATPTPATSRETTKDELDHLAKLKDKKRELDAREEEINRMEAELQKQKEELEVRLSELKQTREEISKILEERVKVDEQKVETLVQMYSNMRPPQAAKIFETLDEDLAIEILGRMKKKNAADIMNLLTPEKAQTFSEKYAGYKRK